jgi:hypothetical protein
MSRITDPYKTVKALFRNDGGEPFELTPGQEEIFSAIYDPEIIRVAVKAYTQYGKSETAALALVSMLVTRREKVLVLGPRLEQSKIIMGNIIKHLFDHYTIEGMLDFEGSREKLRQEQSKKRITFRNGSEVFILTANVREVQKEAKNLMGFGATTVVVDESCLIPDVMFGKILRMVGTGGKLVQLGNPFEKGHFSKAFESSNYKKISIDYKQGIVEGRITEDFINEAKDNMTTLEFKIFYECEFPDSTSENALFAPDWINKAIEQKGVSPGERRAGIDVARFGRDKTVYCLRDGGVCLGIHTRERQDTMETVGWARSLIDSDEPIKTAVDVIGIGAGVYDRLKEEGYSVSGVNVGAKPVGDDDEPTKFFNLKAQMMWYLKDLFKPGPDGKSSISIPNDPDLIQELKEVRYGFDSRKRIKVESKEDMKKRLGRSPDKLDALMLAFADLGDQDVEFYMV